MISLLFYIGICNNKPIFMPLKVPKSYIQAFYQPDKNKDNINCMVALKRSYMDHDYFYTKNTCEELHKQYNGKKRL
jgi:hypothetical protein